MSQMTREINKITKTIIGISGKLILYALVVLLLVEGITRGYAFGHSIFYATPMEEAPGRDFSVTIPEDQKAGETIAMLKDMGLIESEFAVQIQMRFYDYEIYPGTYKLNTSMTSKEILQLLNAKPSASEEESDALEESEDGSDVSGEGAGGLADETGVGSNVSEEAANGSADRAGDGSDVVGEGSDSFGDVEVRIE